MKSINVLVIALLVAIASAANATIGTACQNDHSVCATANAAYCCANLITVTWGKNSSTSLTSTVCLNKTLISNGKANSTASAVNTTASCVTANNSFLVKISAAVASLGFLALFV